MAVAAAYKAVERALHALPGIDTDQASDAVNRDVIESAVDEHGIGAVSNGEVLEAAIDREALDAAVDIDELRDSVADSIGTDDQRYD